MDKKMYQKGNNEASITMLNAILANTYVLFTKVRMFHVNYAGPDFISKHNLLGEYKDLLYSQIDLISEQVQKLCGVAQFSLGEFLSGSIIKDTPGSQVMIENLTEILCDFESLDSGITKAINVIGLEPIGDLVTQSLLIDIRESHDKIKWFLRKILININK